MALSEGLSDDVIHKAVTFSQSVPGLLTANTNSASLLILSDGVDNKFNIVIR